MGRYLKGSLCRYGAVIVVLLACGSAAYAFKSGKKESEDPAVAVRREATKLYNKGVDRQDKAESYYERANQEFTEAIAYYEDAIKKDDSLPEALSNLGYCLRHMNMFDSALAVYARALELKPEFPEALEYRGKAYVILGRLEEAKADLRHLSALDSEMAEELREAIENAEHIRGK